MAVAWLIEQRIACQNCGTRLEEWDEKQGGDRFAYYAKTYYCPGCRSIHTAYEAAIENAKTSKNDRPHMPYLKVRLEPKSEVKAEQYRRRYLGGYTPDLQSDPSRQLRADGTEKPSRRKKEVNIDDMLAQMDSQE